MTKLLVKYGSVIFWTGFKFEDGQKGNKLLVILGAKNGANLLAVLATSQAHGRPKTRGCHTQHSCFFVPGGGPEGFDCDTWLELHRPQEIERKFIGTQAGLPEDKREIRTVLDLKPQFANEFRNCLKLSPDISAAQLALLE